MLRHAQFNVQLQAHTRASNFQSAHAIGHAETQIHLFISVHALSDNTDRACSMADWAVMHQ